MHLKQRVAAEKLSWFGEKRDKINLQSTTPVKSFFPPAFKKSKPRNKNTFGKRACSLFSRSVFSFSFFSFFPVHTLTSSFSVSGIFPPTHRPLLTPALLGSALRPSTRDGPGARTCQGSARPRPSRVLAVT